MTLRLYLCGCAIEADDLLPGGEPRIRFCSMHDAAVRASLFVRQPLAAVPYRCACGSNYNAGDRAGFLAHLAGCSPVTDADGKVTP